MTPEDIKGFFISMDLPKASTFKCSDETHNNIYGMMEHTLRCLMLGGYQADCHSRERQGYGGDGHASLDTTLCLFRADAFYRKWTRDWLDQQGKHGELTYTSPASNHGGGPFWCGFLPAATLKHYYHYGDRSLVEQNYSAIKKWFELAQSRTSDGVQKQFCSGWYLGDWASPADMGIKDRGENSNAELFIQAYMCYALEQASELAEILGKPDDSEEFLNWANERREAVQRQFYNAGEFTYGSGDQVTSILPLAGGVVPDSLQADVFARFENTLKKTNTGHLSTGLAGTYMMVQYLQKIGRDDLIYLFASKTTYPSWGYMIQNGATATWEHWKGNRGTRIHNCYNSIGSWFIQRLAGIQPDIQSPGFKNAIIKPAIVEGLNYVRATHDTLYGTIQSNWTREDDTLKMEIRIPPNTTATIHVPTTNASTLMINGQSALVAPHISIIETDLQAVILHVQSGNYLISSSI
jgi:alpha-L-rhamnosidase